MKRTTLALTLAVMALPLATPLTAQEDFALPEYTDQQRWDRLSAGLVNFQAALVALGEKHGMTAEEVGAFVGDFFSTGWLSGVEARQFMVNYNRNHNAYPGATSELLSAGPLDLQARFNRPWETPVGLDHQMMGVTSDDFLAMNRGLTVALSERVGIETTWESDGDHDVLTFHTEYGPLEATDNLRYGRAFYLSFLTWAQLLDVQMKESGLSARELGARDGERYAPSWTAPTPWALFRGMTWNAMAMDRSLQCEVLSASPEEVRARCSNTIAQRMGQVSGYFDVTEEDMLENSRAFSETVAEYLGMRWEETWEPGYSIIRVSIR